MSKNDASKLIINDTRVMLQKLASLTDYSRGVIYNRNMFIVQATGSINFHDKKLSKVFC